MQALQHCSKGPRSQACLNFDPQRMLYLSIDSGNLHWGKYFVPPVLLGQSAIQAYPPSHEHTSYWMPWHFWENTPNSPPAIVFLFELRTSSRYTGLPGTSAWGSLALGAHHPTWAAPAADLGCATGTNMGGTSESSICIFDAICNVCIFFAAWVIRLKWKQAWTESKSEFL